MFFVDWGLPHPHRVTNKMGLFWSFAYRLILKISVCLQHVTRVALESWWQMWTVCYSWLRITMHHQQHSFHTDIWLSLIKKLRNSMWVLFFIHRNYFHISRFHVEGGCRQIILLRAPYQIFRMLKYGLGLGLRYFHLPGRYLVELSNNFTGRPVGPSVLLRYIVWSLYIV